MDLDSILVSLVVLLAATAICVTLFERLGLGSVVGFIVAGVLVGPHTPGPVATDQVQSLQDISELGVVLFLFTVGLEMLPKQVWAMRRELFGLGLLQVVLSAAPLGAFLYYVIDLHWQSAVIVGLGLAMSSTAVVMTILAGRNQLATSHGRTTFAVLTAQDLSIVPVMALIPLLAHHQAATAAHGPLWIKTGLVIGVLAAIFIVGRYVLPAILGWAARNRNDEAFGVVLFLAILAAALVLDLVGISMTLGAFLLGMLLSASDYRYQIVSTTEPFKGVLMGLFFIAVGMSIDIQMLLTDWASILMLIAVVLVMKTAVLLVLCRLFGSDLPTAIRTAFSLSQVGEFAFVLFGATAAVGLLSERGVTQGFLVIAGSMIVTPLLIKLGESLAMRFTATPELAPGTYAEGMSNHLVIVGLDKVGNVIALMAEHASVPYIAFDRDYRAVIRGKRAGRNVHLGDIYSRTVQEAAGLDRAKAVFIATIDMHRLRGIALSMHRDYPSLEIYAQVNTIEDQTWLRAKGIKHAGTGFIESTLVRGASLLKNMDVAEEQVTLLIDSLRKDDYALIQQALSAEEKSAAPG
jgi:monovalent cation:proton antiporter-2 (CPA2) family protein